MKTFNSSSENGNEMGWLGTATVATIVLLIVVIALTPLWFVLRWFVFDLPAYKINPVYIVSLLAVGLFSRRMIIYAVSFPRRVETARLIYRETKNNDEVHLVNTRVFQKAFSKIVRIGNTLGALFCLENVSDYADKAIMSIIGGVERRGVLFCHVWLSAPRVKHERTGEKSSTPVMNLFFGVAAIPVPVQAYSNDSPPKGYGAFVLHKALDSLYNNMKDAVHPQYMESVFDKALLDEKPPVFTALNGRMEFYDSIRGDWMGRYSIGGESKWSVRDGYFCGEKIDWVPPDQRRHIPKLLLLAKSIKIGK